MHAPTPHTRARDGSSSTTSSSSTYPHPQPQPRKPSLANIAIQSFASFKAQNAASPVRRKPLPANASPIVSSFTSVELTTGNPKLVGNHDNLHSLATNPPTPDAARRLNTLLSPLSTSDFLPRDLDRYPHGQTPGQTPVIPSDTKNRLQFPSNSYTADQHRPRHDRSVSSSHAPQPSRLTELTLPPSRGGHVRSPTMPNMPLYSSQPRQPDLKLQLEGVTEDFLDDDPYSTSPETTHNKPKSPAGKFTSFFGWSSSKSQTGADSPTTTFSEHSLSPAPSPRFPKPPPMPSRSKPTGLDIPVANSFAQGSYFNVPGTPLLSSSPQMNAHVEELERELREVSSELAASIRRELELEDEVERWKAESSTAAVSDGNRRTSDYYSDSGASSIRFPIGDSESKLEEVETLRRKAEQERAQLKVVMAERTQEELRRRRDLEAQVQQLEDQVQEKSEQPPAATSGRVRELEGLVEDAKRRLAEERQVKENFEDLLTALRQDLERHRNERDNLRDEVVPQLRARLEGLETEAGDTQKLVYESTRMQQEIQALRAENQTLVNARRMQLEISQQQTRFQSIAEETDDIPPPSPRVGLSRSNSLARSSVIKNKRGSLSRSNSVKDKSGAESPREGAPSNPVKDLEEQRDALHRALKSLLQRQELQQREFQRRIRDLEIERDNALNLTPRRTTFHKEVKTLREEINHLRRRADDALEQKWQCEKGLGGIRMDLDRAHQETSSLRELLKEHDITIPEIRIENEPISLDKAYTELRTTHALSLARVQQMESSDSLGDANGEGKRTLQLLMQSISDAETERDLAQKEAQEYRQHARALQKSEIEHLSKEQSLASELFAAASRMDELSNRIQQQIQSNQALRVRLAAAIARGEEEQQKSTEKIVELERRLKSAEDKVMVAQQSSEDAISRHEEEVQALKESENSHLRRKKSGLLSPAAFGPNSPASPVFGMKSPRLNKTSSGPAVSMAEATRTELLEKRVEELEKALRDADHEMEEVVGRMNRAQMEVAELQYARDEAMKQTRKLQADIVAEREKVQILMGQK